MTTPKRTPHQQSAVVYFEGDSAILAGAGSGKTTVLVEKVATLVEKLHVPLSRILVVTFTEKAAGEMKGRIAKRLGAGIHDLDPLSIGTIHGTASDLLRRFGAPIGVDPEFSIMNEFLSNLERLRTVRGKFLELIEARHPEALEAVERLGLRESLRFFLKRLGRAPAEGLDGPYAGAFREIGSSYRSRKEKLKMLDFDDLETSLLALLERKEERNTLSQLFDWILVDEFQDTSPIQWKILSHLHRPPKNKLVIVGDPRQSIYRFRRADPSLFLKIAREIQDEGGRLFHLNENFRSAPEVVEFVNLVSAPLFEEHYPPLVATRQDLAGHVDRLSIPVDGLAREIRKSEAKGVADHLTELRRQGHLWKSMALLFRTRHAVSHYVAVLKDAEIPYRASMGESLLERPEVIATTFLLKKCASPPDREKSFIETALSHTPLAGFPPPDAGAAISPWIETFFAGIISLFEPEVHRNLEAFKNLILDLVRLDISDLNSLIDNLASLREEGARIPCPSADDGLGDAVTLMTVHASKGLEFPIVVLCDLAAKPSFSARSRGTYVESSGGEIVLKEKDKDATGLKDRLVKGERFSDLEGREKEEEFEESKRLLYVALTRAKERLVLPLPLPLEKKTRKGQTRSADWSDWLQP